MEGNKSKVMGNVLLSRIQGRKVSEEKKKNGGEERNSRELWLERSFIRPLGLEGACCGYLWRFEEVVQQFVC